MPFRLPDPTRGRVERRAIERSTRTANAVRTIIRARRNYLWLVRDAAFHNRPDISTRLGDLAIQRGAERSRIHRQVERTVGRRLPLQASRQAMNQYHSERVRLSRGAMVDLMRRRDNVGMDFSY